MRVYANRKPRRCRLKGVFHLNLAMFHISRARYAFELITSRVTF